MTMYLRALQEQRENTAPGSPIRFIASTESVKRDGLEIKAESWDLENYRKNPVVLWSHDYRGTHLPIGRADVSVEGNALIASVTFDPDDDFARSIERKYRNGFLNTVSVGWDSHEQGQRNELLDISAVPVPGDPDALMERQVRGLASIGEKLIELTDEPEAPAGDEAEAVWVGTAYRMARLFVSAADDGFDDRAYRKLCRAYKRLDKTPPELPEHVESLGVAELRGLFLAGEAELLPELFVEPVAIEGKAEPDVLARLHEVMTGGK